MEVYAVLALTFLLLLNFYVDVILISEIVFVFYNGDNCKI